MSIAVSAVVKSSSLLCFMVGGISVGAAFVAMVVVTGQVGNLTLWSRIAVAGACFFLALQGFYRIAKSRSTRHIDISGTGQIRLNGQISDSPLGSVAASRYSGELLQLMGDSILWPAFLLLLLQAEDGRISVVPVLRDSVAPDDFRALAVACRWIAARNNPAESKIL